MATLRRNIFFIVITLVLLLALVIAIAYFIRDAYSGTKQYFFIGLIIVMIVASLIATAIIFFGRRGKKEKSADVPVSSKEVNNCIITLKSVSVDAKFSCPTDCKYYKLDECYWALNSRTQVYNHKLEGIIVFFNLSYRNQVPPFFFYPGSVILRDSHNIEHRGVSLCDRISKIGSWGRHCLVNTQENLYVFFPKLDEGTSIDTIRFLGLGKQKGFVEFSSSEINKSLLSFSDFISTDIMDLQLGPLYSIQSKMSQFADGIVRDGLTMILELYEKQLLSRYEVDKILKGFNAEQNEVC